MDALSIRRNIEFKKRDLSALRQVVRSNPEGIRSDIQRWMSHAVSGPTGLINEIADFRDLVESILKGE